MDLPPRPPYRRTEYDAEHEGRTGRLEHTPDAVEARRETAALEDGDERGHADHEDETHDLRRWRL